MSELFNENDNLNDTVEQKTISKHKIGDLIYHIADEYSRSKIEEIVNVIRQSDWNLSDSELFDYVKNRTHYESKGEYINLYDFTDDRCEYFEHTESDDDGNTRIFRIPYIKLNNDYNIEELLDIIFNITINGSMKFTEKLDKYEYIELLDLYEVYSNSTLISDMMIINPGSGFFEESDIHLENPILIPLEFKLFAIDEDNKSIFSSSDAGITSIDAEISIGNHIKQLDPKYIPDSGDGIGYSMNEISINDEIDMNNFEFMPSQDLGIEDINSFMLVTCPKNNNIYKYLISDKMFLQEFNNDTAYLPESIKIKNLSNGKTYMCDFGKSGDKFFISSVKGLVSLLIKNANADDGDIDEDAMQEAQIKMMSEDCISYLIDQSNIDTLYLNNLIVSLKFIFGDEEINMNEALVLEAVSRLLNMDIVLSINDPYMQDEFKFIHKIENKYIDTQSIIEDLYGAEVILPKVQEDNNNMILKVENGKWNIKYLSDPENISDEYINGLFEELYSFGG